MKSKTSQNPAPAKGSPYAALPPLVGWAFFPLGFLARLPLAMLTIGSMTLLVDSTGSYAMGGLSAAMVGLGSAVGGPTQYAERDAWSFNGAGNWNGGGLHFSNDYGNGLLDAHAAVRLWLVDAEQADGLAVGHSGAHDHAEEGEDGHDHGEGPVTIGLKQWRYSGTVREEHTYVRRGNRVWLRWSS